MCYWISVFLVDPCKSIEIKLRPVFFSLKKKKKIKTSCRIGCENGIIFAFLFFPFLHYCQKYLLDWFFFFFGKNLKRLFIFKLSLKNRVNCQMYKCHKTMTIWGHLLKLILPPVVLQRGRTILQYFYKMLMWNFFTSSQIRSTTNITFLLTNKYSPHQLFVKTL